MRSFSVVLFAAIACSAIFAAPQSTTHSFEVADSVIQSKIGDILNLWECARMVASDAIGESDLKGDFHKFAQHADRIIRKELPLCRTAGNIKNTFKCVDSIHLISFTHSLLLLNLLILLIF